MNPADERSEMNFPNPSPTDRSSDIDPAAAEQYRSQASEFINNTSLDDMLAIAEAAVRKKVLERMSEPPQWVLPEDE